MAQQIHVARRQVGVSNECGLHLRVADKFVKLATSYQSEVWVQCKGIIVNGKSILSLLGLAAEFGTLLALEAQGCDAEDAVAALANLISPQTHESEDQHKEAACWSAKTRPTEGPSREGSMTELPLSQRSDRSGKCGPRWDSWKRGSTTGPGIERRAATRGRWLRRGSLSEG
jgi:phosphocarrier protein HPr